ncbi:hypothetical protein CFOL_v3_08866 [Cephalotus follicularis]|uniref:Uncharacterized protein n=1 Tax=Cephalotus follicularis TaxID=3775 RepID=A0A1Q3BBG0_CEPFO|nr:hypothetical protein CFOL_v3_08866 [Cephalotus follicularis]
MGIAESPSSIAPLLLRNLVTSIFIYADESLVTLANKYKLLEIIRFVLTNSFLFFLHLLPSKTHNDDTFSKSADKYVGRGGCDSGIGRALSQLLSIISDVPVSSRKYQVVRSLAESVIDDNHRENIAALHEVNRSVLSAAISRTLNQLEASMVELGRGRVEDDASSRRGPRLNRVLKTVQSVKETAWTRIWWWREDGNRSGCSAEKLAAELLWLSQKMIACGFGEEAVERWASASNLAWLSLWAEPRLQSSLVKVSAYLFRQTKDMGTEEEHCQTKLKMLMSWLPLLCRASNGTDVPVLSNRERAELEGVLEETIDMLGQEEQEQVLSLWLRHFTYCPSSDWPNLHASYARWCTASRKLLLLQ